jgi:hypothetical protein
MRRKHDGLEEEGGEKAFSINMVASFRICPQLQEHIQPSEVPTREAERS